MNTAYLESQIIGCMLKDDSLLEESNLAAYHFQEEAHQILYKKMLELKTQGKKVTTVMLMTRGYDILGQIGGPSLLQDLERKGNPDHFETYESELLENYKESETVRIVSEWLESKKRKDPQQLTHAIERIQDEGASDESDVLSILTEMHNEPFEEPKGELTGIPSGLKELDDLTSGWQPTDSIILGARPSMGKTATMLKFMLGAIGNGDVPIVFSLEMRTKKLLRRLVSAIGKINSFQAKNPAMWLTDGKKNDWTEAVGQLSTWDYEIWDQSNQTVQYIRSKVRKAKKKYADKRIVVLIDYISLIKSSGEFNSKHNELDDVSKKLKGIARDYEIPVITLAQLSRGLEKRDNKRPMNSDLRESGSIEEDADVIMFLYRDSYYDKDNNSDELEIIVSKNRDGATGYVTVDYNRATGVIKDL